MGRNRRAGMLLTAGAAGICMLIFFAVQRNWLEGKENSNDGSYEELKEDTSKEEPLKYIAEDFTAEEGFHTNLPIVVLRIQGEMPDYKSFESGMEQVKEEMF